MLENFKLLIEECLLLVLLKLLFTGIIVRLFSLQINDNKKYLTLSDKNRLREWRLPPVRGEFVDYFDNIIASNLEVYQLHVIPEEVENFRYLMLRLKNILDLNNHEFKKILKQKKKQKSWETIVISENLTWEQFAKVNYYLHDLVVQNQFYLFHVTIHLMIITLIFLDM